MNTYIKTAGVLLLLIIFSNSIFIKNDNLKYHGAATDIKSNLLYYTEEHEELMNKGIHAMTKITYKNKDGQVIASKLLDYTTGFTTPSFHQEDTRNGHSEAVEVNGNKVKINYKPSEKEALKTKTLDLPNGFVVDGGFNYFIKNNWKAVSEGKMVKFNFVVPSQLNYYAFRLRKDKETTFNNKQVITFIMDADNVFIRALVSPIVLTYDKQTHRLVKYEGISNISDNKGGNYVVKITYPTVGP